MEEKATDQGVAPKILRILFAVICFCVFFYQTISSLLLYWTYPVVVDIQHTESRYVQMPAFTICNPIGYNFFEICEYKGICLASSFTNFNRGRMCQKMPEACFDGKMPVDGQIIVYSNFKKKVDLTAVDHDKLRVSLEDYMSCTIEIAGEVNASECNLESVLGSFYTKEDDLPQYCYTIYSLWSQPDKKRLLISKEAVMHLHFTLNTTQRPDPEDEAVQVPMPRFSLPNVPMVQIAVHSPYFLPNPFMGGMKFFGGTSNQMRLRMHERHLAPHSYGTICTDYMKLWKERGGKGPINQMGVIQECRVNKTYEKLGCVPVFLDYPHTYNTCKNCFSDDCKYPTFDEECEKLVDNFREPCETVTYSETKTEKNSMVSIQLESAMLNIKETIWKRISSHECDGNKMWTKRCSTIDVDVHFDRFETENVTYSPKLDGLELFGRIGGYVGLWVGIFYLTVYGVIGSIKDMIKAYGQRQSKIITKKPEENAWDSPPLYLKKS